MTEQHQADHEMDALIREHFTEKQLAALRYVAKQAAQQAIEDYCGSCYLGPRNLVRIGKAAVAVTAAIGFACVLAWQIFREFFHHKGG